MALVYLITNLVNGKRYIGYTSKTLAHRRQQHFQNAKRSKNSGMLISRAIKKYGRDNFRFEILDDGLSVEEACKLEVKFIAERKPEYNIKAGGVSGSHVIKTTKAMREARKARWKPIVLLDAGIVFRNAKRIEKVLGIDKYFVRRACLSEQKGRGAISAHGMHFAYYHDGFTEEELQARLAALKEREKNCTKTRGGNRLEVVCTTDGTKHASLIDAERKYSIGYKAIANLCRTGAKSKKGGLQFMFASQSAPVDPQPTYEHQRDVKRRNGLLGAKAMSKSIACLDDGAVYSSISEAARAIGASSCHMSHCVRLNKPIRGLRFAYHQAA